MNQQPIKETKAIFDPKKDENILVVKREKILENEAWQGLKELDDNFLDLIIKEKEFLPRSEMEINPEYKQIIPYLVFSYNKTYFLMQRKSTATEQRLKNKYSLGIGGHIRKEDIQGNNIISWAKREFNEEVNYNGTFEIKPIGMINDDSDLVGKVHLGIVFLLNGNSSSIEVNSELKSGNLLSLDECEFHYHSMESWSQTVFNFLKNKS